MDRRRFLSLLGLGAAAAVAPTKTYAFFGNILRPKVEPLWTPADPLVLNVAIDKDLAPRWEAVLGNWRSGVKLMGEIVDAPNGCSISYHMSGGNIWYTTSYSDPGAMSTLTFIPEDDSGESGR